MESVKKYTAAPPKTPESINSRSCPPPALIPNKKRSAAAIIQKSKSARVVKITPRARRRKTRPRS